MIVFLPFIAVSSSNGSVHQDGFLQKRIDELETIVKNQQTQIDELKSLVERITVNGTADTEMATSNNIHERKIATPIQYKYSKYKKFFV